MPPKDTKIGRMNGRFFVLTEDGYKPLGEIQEVEITEEPPALDIDGTMPVRIVKEPAEITGTITFTDEVAEAWRELTALVDAAWRGFKQMMELLEKSIAEHPNRRVVHLALHHHDPLVRKKNLKRLLHYKTKTK